MFKLDRVQIALESERNSRWEFRGKTVKGVERVFTVIDRNYVRQNRWAFVVREPDDVTNYIGVMPIAVPNRKVWAGLERRSLQFAHGTVGRYAKCLYAKLSIEDVGGDKTKRTLTEEYAIPAWIKQFGPKPKRKVALTDGTDGRHLVSVVKPNDFAAMIRLFVALKGWVRDSKYNPQKAWAHEAARRHQLATNKPLRGMRIAITGRLVRDVRTKVYAWLRRLGAEPKDHVTSITQLLVVGVHYKDEDRKKIRDADRVGIPRLTESKFYEKYQI